MEEMYISLGKYDGEGRTECLRHIFQVWALVSFKEVRTASISAPAENW